MKIKKLHYVQLYMYINYMKNLHKVLPSSSMSISNFSLQIEKEKDDFYFWYSIEVKLRMEFCTKRYSLDTAGGFFWDHWHPLYWGGTALGEEVQHFLLASEYSENLPQQVITFIWSYTKQIKLTNFFLFSFFFSRL